MSGILGKIPLNIQFSKDDIPSGRDMDFAVRHYRGNELIRDTKKNEKQEKVIIIQQTSNAVPIQQESLQSSNIPDNTAQLRTSTKKKKDKKARKKERPTFTIDNITDPQSPYGSAHASTIGFKIMEIFGANNKTHKTNKKILDSYTNENQFTSGAEQNVPTSKEPRPDSEIAALASIMGNRDSAKDGAKLDSILHSRLQSIFKNTPTQNPLRVKLYIRNSAFFPCTRDGTKRPGMPCDEYIPSIIPTLQQQYPPNTEFRIKVSDPRYITRYGYKPSPDGSTRSKIAKYD